MTVFENVTKEDAAKLLKSGYVMQTPKTIHEDLRLSKGAVNLVLYKSGKLLIQGKDIDKVVEYLEKLKIGELVRPEVFRKESGWVIGTDESLKGDTFGGLVVAGVKANDKERDGLKGLGVADSKRLADEEIIVMAQKIKRIVPCEVKALLPEEYNHNFKNVTLLLDNLHHEVGNFLKPGKHVVDKYPGCTVGDLQVTKGESKYIEIAAASVLARAQALAQMNYLSKKAGFDLPKGSTHVKDALLELKKKGLPLKEFIKLHFKNVQEFL